MWCSTFLLCVIRHRWWLSLFPCCDLEAALSVPAQEAFYLRVADPSPSFPALVSVKRLCLWLLTHSKNALERGKAEREASTSRFQNFKWVKEFLQSELCKPSSGWTPLLPQSTIGPLVALVEFICVWLPSSCPLTEREQLLLQAQTYQYLTFLRPPHLARNKSEGKNVESLTEMVAILQNYPLLLFHFFFLSLHSALTSEDR